MVRRWIAIGAVLAAVICAGAVALGMVPPSPGMCYESGVRSLRATVAPIVHGTGRRLLEEGGCDQWDEVLSYSATYAKTLDCPAVVAAATRTLGPPAGRDERFREDLLIDEGTAYFDVGWRRIHVDCDSPYLTFVAEPRHPALWWG